MHVLQQYSTSSSISLGTITWACMRTPNDLDATASKDEMAPSPALLSRLIGHFCSLGLRKTKSNTAIPQSTHHPPQRYGITWVVSYNARSPPPRQIYIRTYRTYKTALPSWFYRQRGDCECRAARLDGKQSTTPPLSHCFRCVYLCPPGRKSAPKKSSQEAWYLSCNLLILVLGVYHTGGWVTKTINTAVPLYQVGNGRRGGCAACCIHHKCLCVQRTKTTPAHFISIDECVHTYVCMQPGILAWVSVRPFFLPINTQQHTQLFCPRADCSS